MPMRNESKAQVIGLPSHFVSYTKSEDEHTCSAFIPDGHGWVKECDNIIASYTVNISNKLKEENDPSPNKPFHLCERHYKRVKQTIKSWDKAEEHAFFNDSEDEEYQLPSKQRDIKLPTA